MGPCNDCRKFATEAASVTRFSSGFAMARTSYPCAHRTRATPYQLAVSAQAPCTNTTVGRAVPEPCPPGAVDGAPAFVDVGVGVAGDEQALPAAPMTRASMAVAQTYPPDEVELVFTAPSVEG